jgi:hypothetical protein
MCIKIVVQKQMRRMMFKKLMHSLLITALLAPSIQAGDIQSIENKINETSRVQQIINDNKNPQQTAVIVTVFLMGILARHNKKSLLNAGSTFAWGMAWPFTIRRVFSVLQDRISGKTVSQNAIAYGVYLLGVVASTYGTIKLYKNYQAKKGESSQPTKQQLVA